MSVRPVRNKSLVLISLGSLILSCQQPEPSGFSSEWPQEVTRVWLGPEYWANPLQDWRLSSGRIECVTSGGDRNVFLLTHEISGAGKGFQISVETGYLSQPPKHDGWVGFKIGIRGEFDDYRDDAVRGEGLPLGITTNGHLFIGSKVKENAVNITLDAVRLNLTAEQNVDEPDTYNLTIEINHADSGEIESFTESVEADWLKGGLALVCNAGSPPKITDTREIYQYPDWGTDPDTPRRGDVNFWFDHWKISGDMIQEYPERKWGPVLFNQFTIHQEQVRMTAQFPPLGPSDPLTAYLEIMDENWETVDTALIDTISYTAQFDYTPLNLEEAIPYRITYSALTNEGAASLHHYRGTLPANPTNKQDFVLAAFTGNNDLGFPNSDLVENVRIQDPDLLFFSGDQIYEGVGGYGVQRNPLSLSVLDYLRKWYLFGWAYGELLRDIPVVTIPDDHDVYHGNLWGESGKATDDAETESGKQDTGGYKMPAEWVNMVQKTQTSHLPDPYETTPVKQGISVYYTNLEYAGISFAILEDRKFKSAPKLLLPEAQVDNGWAQNPEFDPITQSDHPEARLLGQRQLDFLEYWVEHWGADIWMKAVLSQTIFANLATLPVNESGHDRIVPQLRILSPGEYAPNDIQVADMDSNGWPKSGRDRAVAIIRKAFALHIAGDQHLGSTVEYGLNEFGDAGFALCVPSISNVWPRRWYPPPSDQEPPYKGNFLDGFGNKVTVYAVSNPLYTGRQPAKLYDRATGYGIVRFRAADRKIIMENWPRDAHPLHDHPYPGWPVVIDQLQNYQPKNGIFIPKISSPSLKGSLLQIYDLQGNHVLTLRAGSDSLRLSVPKSGKYRLHISSGKMESQEFEVSALPDNQEVITLP